MSLNLGVILRESAKRYKDRDALLLGDAKLSYGGLHSSVQKLAGGLLKLGVKRGQHVALMMPNVPHFTIAYFACHYVGAPVVPLNMLLRIKGIQRRLGGAHRVLDTAALETLAVGGVDHDIVGDMVVQGDLRVRRIPLEVI